MPWSEEQLEAWARDNITSATKDPLPQPEWHQKQVAIWARKVLDFPKKSEQILLDQEINGKALLDPPVKSLSELIALLPGIPTGQTKRMWDVIEKLNN
jgi:hypothetical protein